MGYGARRGAALGREARRSNLHVRHAMLAVCALATVHILHRLLSMYRAPVERLSLPVLSRVELPEYRPTAFPPPHAKPLTTGHPVVPIRTARACFNASWTRGGVDCRMADRKHTTYVPESHSKRVLPLPMLAQPPLVVLTFAGGPQARQLLPLFLHSMQHASAATLRATVVLNTDMPALALCLELHVDESLCVLFTDGGAQLHDLERLKSEKSRLHYKFLSLMWDKVDVIMVRGRSSCLVCLWMHLIMMVTPRCRVRLLSTGSPCCGRTWTRCGCATRGQSWQPRARGHRACGSPPTATSSVGATSTWGRC
jgi:hypothetical protein